MLMVGDTLGTDILGAQRAGIATCLTLFGGMTEYIVAEREEVPPKGSPLYNAFIWRCAENPMVESNIFPDYIVGKIY